MQKIGNGKGRVRNFARGKKTLQHLQGQHQGIISRKYCIKRYTYVVKFLENSADSLKEQFVKQECFEQNWFFIVKLYCKSALV